MNRGERDARVRRGLKRGEKSKKVRRVRNQQKENLQKREN
jgi:hypothetical protein